MMRRAVPSLCFHCVKPCDMAQCELLTSYQLAPSPGTSAAASMALQECM